jgi:hypothetical protein
MASAVAARVEVLLTDNTRDFRPGQMAHGMWRDEPYTFAGESLF